MMDSIYAIAAALGINVICVDGTESLSQDTLLDNHIYYFDEPCKPEEPEEEPETYYGISKQFVIHLVWLVRINLRKLPDHFL